MKYLKLFENYQSESEVTKICEKYGITDWKLNPNGLVDVDGDIDLSMKGLTELPLKFGEVTGSFNCYKNRLTSLKGAPHTVRMLFFSCEKNNIRSFEGLVHISGNFYCTGNPVEEIWDIINPRTDKWDNEKMDFFNDLDIIRGEEIAIERLNFFLEEIGLDTVESVKGYKNIY